VACSFLLGLSGAVALKEALRTNTGLVHLDIGSNRVKRNDWEEMVKHESTIKALVSVDVSLRHISRSTYK
jgi:hypothetical protein